MQLDIPSSSRQPSNITVNPGYPPFTAGGQFHLRPELTLFLAQRHPNDAAYDDTLGYLGLPRVHGRRRLDFGG